MSIARGIPSSPRRSHRGGHPKSKKREEEEDDGGQTRCVCNQQHHEGVMIQCETCKVWQHCPCVGLGNGEVTPDKYYCDSCRPENHPYRVQDGQLAPSSKRAYHTPSTISAGSKAKVSKKRSTISKDASHLTEPEQGSDDNASETMLSNKASKGASDNLSNGYNRASKRRKRTESNMDEDGLANDGIAYSPDNEDCEDNYIPDYDQESHADAANISLKAMGKNKISRSSKSKKVKTSATHSLPGSPQDFIDDSSEPHDGQAAEPSETPSPQQQTSRRVNGKKGARLSENDAITAMTPSVKRKKVNKSETPQHEESLPTADHSDELNRAFANESSMEPLTTPGTSNDSHSTPHSTTKRAGSRRGHAHTVCPDTPTPTGTPQPMQPAPPAKVKYPSSRMSLKDMNKRAQQLLEYIGRVQAEMAELKNRSSQKSPASVECDVSSQGLTVNTELQSLNAGSTDAVPKWLSTPPQSVHELSHGDGSEQTTKSLPNQDTDQSDVSRSGEEKGKTPITPPHQPMTTSHNGPEPMEEDSDDARQSCAENPGMIPAAAEVTSLDLIDKLTGNLILFQKRFGRYGD
ncbi:hypothetical protein BGZ80_001642 [Entomortierella chlamydospora]|uniref:Zinc finger PHD-type domain-containing protein n=1 Tax=Entomortierella chlamydospora TaxID=101097 RepID=A0A9P6N1L1_9FUNG|nr:hypothetical protein BGZ80_001642 [Entomortierella chlamydospora]